MLRLLKNRLAKSFRSSRRRCRRHNETTTYNPLENRELLATLLAGGNGISYQDADGDAVVVAFSRRFLTPENANHIFRFDVGGVDGNNSLRQQLRSINLNYLAGAVGCKISVGAIRNAAAGGDGKAHVGQIFAAEIDLSDISITGDLGRILAGDSNPTSRGLGNLKVDSIGKFGTTTGAQNLNSRIMGSMGDINVASSIDLATIVTEEGGSIGKVTIGTWLQGGADQGSGSIRSSGSIGDVWFGGNIQGGRGHNSGVLSARKGIGHVRLGASLIGGIGNFSGNIYSATSIGSVTIEGSVRGDQGISSGMIYAAGSVGEILIRSSIFGHEGDFSGRVVAGTADRVIVGRNVSGFSGRQSGTLLVDNLTNFASIGGNLESGTGAGSGCFQSGGFTKSLTIGGDVIGGFSTTSIELNQASRLTIRGLVRGARLVISESVQNFTAEQGIVPKFIGPQQFSSDLRLGRVTNMTVGSVLNSDISCSKSIRTLNVTGGLGLRQARIFVAGEIASRRHLAIGTLDCRGNVEDSMILAGRSLNDRTFNLDAQIDRVFVLGSWSRSVLTAGCPTLTASGEIRKITAADLPPTYTLIDHSALIARIGEITIAGSYVGSADFREQQSGFFAEAVGSLSVNRTAYRLNAGPGNDKILLHLGTGIYEYRSTPW